MRVTSLSHEMVRIIPSCSVIALLHEWIRILIWAKAFFVQEGRVTPGDRAFYTRYKLWTYPGLTLKVVNIQGLSIDPLAITKI